MFCHNCGARLKEKPNRPPDYVPQQYQAAASAGHDNASGQVWESRGEDTSSPVCPQCGAEATGHLSCPACGMHLQSEERVTTREESERARVETTGPPDLIADGERASSPRQARRFLPLGAGGVAVIAAVAVGLLGWMGGQEEREASKPVRGESGNRAPRPAATDRALVRCVDSWNSNGRSLLANTVGQAVQGARVFVFSDDVCGLTVPDQAQLGSFAVRGGNWEPYVNTRGQGFGQSPHRALLVNAMEFSATAERESNVIVNHDGTVEAKAEARIGRESAPSALTVQNIDGTTSADQPYVLDAAGWDRLSMDQRIKAVAAYAVEENCPISEVPRIAEALKAERFDVVDNSVERTLSAWCVGETPKASDSPSADSPRTAPSTQEGPLAPEEGKPRDPNDEGIEIRFHTGRDDGEEAAAAYCSMGAKPVSRLYCWTPNDGFTLRLDDAGARRIRVGELANRSRTPRYPKLALGERRRAFGFVCTSRSSGLRCVNNAGHGWDLPRYVGLPRMF